MRDLSDSESKYRISPAEDWKPCRFSLAIGLVWERSLFKKWASEQTPLVTPG